MSSTAQSIPPEVQAPAPTQGEPGDADPPLRRGLTGYLQIIAVVAAVGLAIAYSRDDSAAEVAPPSTYTPAAQTQSPASLARVMLPQRRPAQISLEATGTVEDSTPRHFQQR